MLRINERVFISQKNEVGLIKSLCYKAVIGVSQ